MTFPYCFQYRAICSNKFTSIDLNVFAHHHHSCISSPLQLNKNSRCSDLQKQKKIAREKIWLGGWDKTILNRILSEPIALTTRSCWSSFLEMSLLNISKSIYQNSRQVSNRFWHGFISMEIYILFFIALFYRFSRHICEIRCIWV